VAIAEHARSWAKTLDPNGNSYLQDIKNLLTGDKFPAAKAGWVASAIATMESDIARKAGRLYDEKLDEHSQHVGNIGETLKGELKLVGKRPGNPGRFGTSYWHKFRDEKGNAYIWWASSPSDLQQEQKYHVSFKIKKHDEWNNVKQTIINYVKEV